MTSVQSAFLAALLMAVALGRGQSTPAWTTAVNHAAQAAPDARIIVLDRHSGQILASHRFEEAGRTLAAPGSTLKPLVLYKLLASGRWNPERRIACDRMMLISGHRLACSHPAAPPFDARAALAWSCNSYFAEAARSLHPGDLGELLRSTGLLGPTGLSDHEATAEFHEPLSPQDTQLTVLGIEGIRITPLELATAYRWLTNEIDAHPDAPSTITIRSGLADSADFGMAQAARQNIVPVAGKTGTAEGADSHRTHGWFAGFAPVQKAQVVIVVYLPTGRGADAAHVAGLLLAHSPLHDRKP